MKINITDYKNIGHLKYILEDNKVNLLFGLCGAGKTSISQAVRGEDVTNNKKVNSSNEPTIKINDTDNINYKISVFSDELIDKYIRNANAEESVFSVLVDNENDYIEAAAGVEKVLQNIIKELSLGREHYENLCKIKKQLGATVNKDKKTISQKSTIYKAQQAFIKTTNKRLMKEINSIEEKKYEWIVTGVNKFYSIDDSKCPFCQKIISKSYSKKLISYSNFESKTVNSLKLDAHSLSDLKLKRSPTSESEIQKLYSSVVKICNAVNDYERVDKFIEECRDFNFTTKHKKELELTEDFYMEFKKMRPLLKSLYRQIDKLEQKIVKAKEHTKSILNKKLNLINSIFINFDIPYEIVASYKRGKIDTYKLSLLTDYNKKDKKNSLSNGEKVIVSLVLFILENAKLNADLIIIDDPVSSFDEIRRGQIFDLIKKHLENKTVLILSHDSVFTKYAFLNANKKIIGNVDYLDNHDDLIKIENIAAKDIGYYETFIKQRLLENEDLPYYIKILNLRLLYEPLSRNYKYRYLSRIIHCEKPTKILDIKGIKDENALLNEILEETGVSLPKFDISYYDSIATDKLVDLEKAMLLREMDNKNFIDINGIRQQINDLIHLNSAFILCIDPYKFNFCTRVLRNAMAMNLPNVVKLK